MKPLIARKWVELVYKGFFFEPLKRDLESYLASSQRYVTGGGCLCFRPAVFTGRPLAPWRALAARLREVELARRARSLLVASRYMQGELARAGLDPARVRCVPYFTDSATAPSLSPDGKMVTFVRGGGPFLSDGQIYVKLLPNGESVRLTSDNEIKYAPAFSPDGSRVSYT